MERVSVSWVFRACMLFMLMLSSWGAVSAADVSGTYEPGEVIIQYNDIGSGTAVVSVASSLNAQIGAETILTEEILGVKGLQVVKVPDSMSVPEAVEYYKSNEYVAYAEPNYITYLPNPTDDSGITEENLDIADVPMNFPNDPGFSLQWGLYSNNTTNVSTGRSDIHAPEAWNVSTGSSDVIVAVIDSGVDYNHEDLAENCLSGYDFVNSDTDPMDDNGHGTHCAGILGAVTNNNLGIAGVSWNSKILPVKVFDAAGTSNTVLEIQGILYASEMGADIISCSWGTYYNSEILKEVIDNTPALFVCSSGNDGYDTDKIPHYPSGYDSPHVISVGASDESNLKAWFSNYGVTTVDLMAPGVSIYSTTPGSYGFEDGTSMAVPFVAGTAALIKSEKPANEPVQIKNLLMSTVDKKYWLNQSCVSGGRLNAYNALSQVLPLQADFSANPASGTIPLNVQFTDHSTGEPTKWHWSFGDGYESTTQNPVHLYMKPGRYSITLTVSNEGLSSVAEKENYIHVKPPYQPVKAFPDGTGGNYPTPTDPDDDGLFEDINGNGWLEYDDTKLLFNQILFAMKEEPIGQFDFDGSGFIGFGDVVKLYQMV
jgi:thermitase